MRKQPNAAASFKGRCGTAVLLLLMAGCGETSSSPYERQTSSAQTKNDSQINVAVPEEPESSTDVAPDAEGSAPSPGEDADWRYEEGTDPINDAVFRRASGAVFGNSYRFEVTIECRPPHIYSYQFRAFGEGGRPAAFKSRFQMGSAFADAGERVLVTFRPDAGQAVFGAAEPRTADQLSIGRFNIMRAEEVVSANVLTIRLPMTDADETIQIDQTNPTIESVLEACRTRARGSGNSAEQTNDTADDEPEPQR